MADASGVTITTTIAQTAGGGQQAGGSAPPASPPPAPTGTGRIAISVAGENDANGPTGAFDPTVYGPGYGDLWLPTVTAQAEPARHADGRRRRRRLD